MKKNYNKPAIHIRKVKLNFFLNETAFLSAIDDLLVPSVFAVSGGCFLKGTKILMADGTTKEIQNITKDDTVASFDVDNQSITPEKVARPIIHPYYKGGYYLINGTLKVTGNHPMWSPEQKKWVQLRDFKIGDTLLNNNNQCITVKSMEKKRGINYVYNLNLIGQNHTYFAENILVHNIGTDNDNFDDGLKR